MGGVLRLGLGPFCVAISGNISSKSQLANNILTGWVRRGGGRIWAVGALLGAGAGAALLGAGPVLCSYIGKYSHPSLSLQTIYSPVGYEEVGVVLRMGLLYGGAGARAALLGAEPVLCSYIGKYSHPSLSLQTIYSPIEYKEVVAVLRP